MPICEVQDRRAGMRDDTTDAQLSKADPSTAVGYKSPPLRSRFKPGQSGNPKGRAKGSRNLKTIFQKIMSEEVSLREGSEVKKISKAEAVMRGVGVGALRGDTRSLAMLFRLAEHAGEFDQAQTTAPLTQLVVSWKHTPIGTGDGV